jgi:hypothetical protein
MGIILTPQWDDDAIRRLSDIYDSTPVLEVPTETASANTAIP